MGRKVGEHPTFIFVIILYELSHQRLSCISNFEGNVYVTRVRDEETRKRLSRNPDVTLILRAQDSHTLLPLTPT